MAVLIGHASGSENGTIRGKAGDQTGREVYTRGWYKHSKGWVTLEFIDPMMAGYAAEAMEMACANPDIGYNQYENGTLWENVKTSGWNPSMTTKKVNTDCARLIRVCVQYAAAKCGMDIIIPDFYTATLVGVLMKTGLFKKHTDAKYNTQDKYLRRGMIQVTRTKGHTLMVLENGKGAEETAPPADDRVLGGRTLRNGMEGEDVKELQALLIQFGYDLGRWGADGDFGDMTEMAVREFQQAEGLEADGIVGKITYAVLMKAKNDIEPENPTLVRIEGGNCYIRSQANVSGAILGVAYAGEKLAWLGETTANGWHKIRKDGIEGYVSGKYGRKEG